MPDETDIDGDVDSPGVQLGYVLGFAARTAIFSRSTFSCSINALAALVTLGFLTAAAPRMAAVPPAAAPPRVLPPARAVPPLPLPRPRLTVPSALRDDAHQYNPHDAKMIIEWDDERIRRLQ